MTLSTNDATRRAFLTAVGGGVLGVSMASVEPVSASQETRTTIQEGDSNTFTARIENVSRSDTLQPSEGGSQPVPISPGAYAVFSNPNTLDVEPPFFSRGSPTRDNGLEALAESGNPSPLADNTGGLSHVSESGVFDTPVGNDTSGPAGLGEAYEFTFDATPGERFSFATMFIPSNDLFFSPFGLGIPLFFDVGGEPKPVSMDVTDDVFLWDAGTEKNEEPGAGPNQAPRQSDAQAGQNEGQDTPVRFVSDVDDGYTYPDVDEVIAVKIWPDGL